MCILDAKEQPALLKRRQFKASCELFGRITIGADCSVCLVASSLGKTALKRRSCFICTVAANSWNIKGCSHFIPCSSVDLIKQGRWVQEITVMCEAILYVFKLGPCGRTTVTHTTLDAWWRTDGSSTCKVSCERASPLFPKFSNKDFPDGSNHLVQMQNLQIDFRSA